MRTRLELATYGVTGRYSNQLNYRTICFMLRSTERLSSQKRVQNYCFYLIYANVSVIFLYFSVQTGALLPGGRLFESAFVVF